MFSFLALIFTLIAAIGHILVVVSSLCFIHKLFVNTNFKIKKLLIITATVNAITWGSILLFRFSDANFHIYDKVIHNINLHEECHDSLLITDEKMISMNDYMIYDDCLSNKGIVAKSPEIPSKDKDVYDLHIDLFIMLHPIKKTENN